KAKTQADRRRARENRPPDQPAASTLDDLTWRELRGILHQELQCLPEQYRAALLLCYWEGKTRDEAAVQLGSSAGAFKKTLERAPVVLRSRLARRGLVLSAAVAALLSGNGAQAAIGPALVQGTAQAALRFVTGKGTAGGASAAAVTLAEGALRAMH